MSEHRDQVLVRATPDFLDALDKWRREQKDLPTRAEAMRRLALIAMETRHHDSADRRVGRHRPTGLEIDVPQWFVQQIDAKAKKESLTREEMAFGLMLLGSGQDALQGEGGGVTAADLARAKQRSAKQLDAVFRERRRTAD
ncbi:hypothetical protein [Terricaulis silvestris]|uniref:Uncharacterized protein n=1 Tax=Terricaulis silvestris TaxID=2686094 RepID=A0A6I6MPU2_9CAUL|nr:hypothetical protein [Terricaulis silvestris]QGZ94884.1 hypothetical protein DSM104635_01717 [Terricaulis silvestris]